MLQRIIRTNVIFFKLLKNDQNEDIEHYQPNDYDKSDEEEEVHGIAAGFPRDAAWRMVHCVIHQFVPTLTCGKTEEVQ